NSALFTGGVHVVHPRLNLSCDTMAADLTGVAAKDSQLVAQGGADFQLLDEDHSVHGICDKVVYTYSIASGVTNNTAVLTANPLLATDKLVKEYRHRRVVNGVSINVSAGEIVGLLGPNGAGKTTTFNMVVGVVGPDSGAVTFQGRNITRLPMHKRARLGIGYL